MKKKRLSALFFTVVMCCSMLAGCGATSSSASSAVPGSQTNATGNPEYAEPVEITVFRSADTSQSYNDETYVNYIKEKFNLTLNYEYAPSSAAIEKLNLSFATGEYADMIEVAGVSELGRYAADGFLLPMNEHWEQLSEYKNAYEEDEWELMLQTYKSGDGNLYFLPQRMAPSATSSNVWMYRVDEFEKAGIALPKTTDEFLEAMRALKRINPDLTIPNRWGLANALEGFNIAFRTGYDIYMDIDTNQVEYGPITDKFRALLIFMNTLYSEGILHNEFVTMTPEQRVAEVTKGNVYANFQFPGAEAGLNSYQASAGLPEDWAYDTEALLLTAYPDKEPMYQDYALYMSYGIALTDNLEGERLDRVLEYLNWSASEEGQLFHEYGIEGVHHEMDGDVPVWLDSEDGVPYGEIIGDFGPFGYYLIQNDPGAAAAYPLAAEINEVTKDMDAMFYGVVPNQPTEEEESQMIDDKILMDSTRDEWTLAFIIGTKNPNDDAQWQAYLDKMNEVGASEYLELYRTANARVMQ